MLQDENAPGDPAAGSRQKETYRKVPILQHIKTMKQNKVYFIGAGPGDPELITCKGQRLLREADLVLYAGSLVPPELVACARQDARVVDSAPLALQRIVELMCETVRAGGLVARVHTGDPTLYGALREQMAALDERGVDYEIIPGVSAAFAAAAAAKISLTIPEDAQSLVIARAQGKTPVPQGQRLAEWAAHGAPMAVYLSGQAPETPARELLDGGLSPATPVILAHRVGWPEQRLLRTTLADMAALARHEGLLRQTLFLVLPAEAGQRRFSKLYDPDEGHEFRTAKDNEE